MSLYIINRCLFIMDVASAYCAVRTEFLDAFEKLRKASISFIMSVRLTAWSSSAPTRWIFMKFDI